MEGSKVTPATPWPLTPAPPPGSAGVMVSVSLRSTSWNPDLLGEPADGMSMFKPSNTTMIYFYPTVARSAYIHTLSTVVWILFFLMGHEN